MTEYVCSQCGNRTNRTLNLFAHTKCPSCGAEGTLVEPNVLEEQTAREKSRLETLARLHFEPADWRAVGASLPLFGESQNAKKIEKILNSMAAEGWEFVFLGDSARLVDGPVLIFKRKRLEPKEAVR